MCWPASQTFCPDLDAYVRRKCLLLPGQQLHATLPRQGLGHHFYVLWGSLGGWPCFSWLPFSSRFKTLRPGKKGNSRNGSFPLSSFWKLCIKCPKLFIKCLKLFMTCRKLFVKCLKLCIKQPILQISIFHRIFVVPPQDPPKKSVCLENHD